MNAVAQAEAGQDQARAEGTRTEAQAAASRANGAKSRGPVTA